ncbi:MAG: 3D domain-containing protein [Actinomycetota bacterium]|nr:3D domain-containing protein [Actinomycetota bacterium]
MTYKSKLNVFVFKSIIIFFLVISLTQGFFFLIPAPVEAATLQELANNISKLSTDEQNLLEEVVAAETQIAQKEREIRNYQEKLDNFEVELEDLYVKSTQLEKNMSAIKAKIQESAVKAYKYGSDNAAKLIISARSLNEIATVLYIYRRMIRENNSLLEELKNEKEIYEMTFRKSEDTKKRISELKDQIVKEKDTLTVYLEEKKNLLSQVKSEKSKFMNLLAEIKQRINQIQPPGLVLVGEWDMVATAYFSGGGGINGNSITAIGLRTKKGIVAVDPKIIPLGTKLYIPGYGEALAADTGGWIKGNRIDLVFDSLEECYRYGRRKIKVYLVQK